jgi:hypothetical protein
MAKFMVLYRSPTPATEMMTQMTDDFGPGNDSYIALPVLAADAG